MTRANPRSPSGFDGWELMGAAVRPPQMRAASPRVLRVHRAAVRDHCGFGVYF